MGRASRRKKERREQAKNALTNPITRKAVAIASRGKVVKELKNATTEEQIEVLSSISPSKVGKAIMKKAPKEIDKGIRDFQKRSERITVENLLKEVRETPGFLPMCERAGVPYSWFEQLAHSRIKACGIVED